MTAPVRHGDWRPRTGREPRVTPRTSHRPGVTPQDVTPPRRHTADSHTAKERHTVESKTARIARNRLLVVRCTPEELAEFHRLSAAIGVTTSELVRGVLLMAKGAGKKTNKT